MKVAVFSSKPYDREFLLAEGDGQHEFTFIDSKLDSLSAKLAHDHRAVCCFVNDKLNSDTLAELKRQGVELITLRCAGFNNVDIDCAQKLGITVARVQEYSPHAVAEHALALILDLNRNIHRAYNRVRENDYSLHGLMGFDLYGKTVGIIGTGLIGSSFAKIMLGLGCQVIATDPIKNDQLIDMGVQYADIEQVLTDSDILSLHCPLTAQTQHIINQQALEKMKHGCMLINTSRGDLVDTHATIDALKSQKLGYLGLDVYEEEANLFFEDQSDQLLQDDTFARLLTFSNVVLTGHQAFFTREAMRAIAMTTIENLNSFEQGKLSGLQAV